MKIALLNCAIITNDGEYKLKSIKASDIGNFISVNGGEENILSAIGHQGTAEALTELLGIEVKVNRIQFQQEVGQKALIFKMNGRIPEGKILSKDELYEIGFSFKILERIDGMSTQCPECGRVW